MKSFLFLSADPTEITTIISIATVAALFVLIVILCTVKRTGKHSETRALAYAAVCVAASFVLSFIKFEMPFGGSITLASFVPIFIYSYVFGFRRGLLAGFVYGLLQFIQSPFFVNIFQFFLDYILAFMSIALAGIFKKLLKEKLAVILGLLSVGIVRLIMHILAGIIFFNEGLIYETLPANNAFIYSLAYNGIYVAPDILISVIVMFILLFTGAFRRLQIFLEHSAKINSKDNPPAEDKVEPVGDKVEPVEDKVEPVEDKVEPVEDKVEPVEDKVD